MSETIEIKQLMSLRSMRPALRELSTEQIERIHDNAAELLVERQKEEEQIAEQEALKAEKLDLIVKMMQEDGIDAEDVLARAKGKAVSKGKRKELPPKYVYKDDEGNEKTWTGQGRTPAPIQKAIDNGASKEDFLIEKA
ncbi:H-NS family nucleoid-associated regulatory protein [Vibrio parahaemolyticus]|uniref:H-NS histone family protein n=1 Tax=Vibrio parahaemolyticus TaxID=670 RepID=UPI0031CC8708